MIIGTSAGRASLPLSSYLEVGVGAGVRISRIKSRAQGRVEVGAAIIGTSTGRASLPLSSYLEVGV